ncbi:hypothetical protein Cantr_07998 [Candida viswanathii]|uniref:Transporter n=1 Tax=Candida viswanathii TaxID=5486 RepID=A0A367Y7D0_9ASCO|nr:hypothetical protein Cantr_07998 [Candida viswanathii]
MLNLLSSDIVVVSPSPLSYFDISFLTFEAVLEVVIICFAGFIAAKSGLLTTQGQKSLSALNVDLFTPCLIFSKLASNLSLSKLIEIIIIPVFYAVSTFISFGCSKFTSYLLGLNAPESDFVTAMAVFGNSNSLPVSLTLSLAYTLPDLIWDDIPDDNNDKVAGRGILYLLIFQQLGQVLRWSWGFNTLLRKRSQLELNTYYTKNGKVVIYEQCRLISPDEVEQTLYIQDEHQELETTREIQSSEEEEQHHRPVADTKGFADLPGVKQFLAFMNPPLYAMLISVVVASVPYLKDLFFGTENGGSFVHNTLTKSITGLGSVSIPLILIVLGSNLYPSSDIPPPSKHYNRILIGSLLSRMILPSIILLPIIAICVKYINTSILDDPIFLIVAFILTISPPAIQLSQITQLNNVYQKEMSGVLFWGYVVLTVPTTIFIVVCSLKVLEWSK